MYANYSDVDTVATGEKIRLLRKKKGLKVTDVSDYMGFEGPQAVYKWQRGESMPDLGNMIKLLELLEITDIRELVVMTGSAEEALPLLWGNAYRELINQNRSDRIISYLVW